MNTDLHNEIIEMHNILWRDVQNAVLHCIAYKSDVFRKEGKKPVITIGWTGADAFIDSRESIHYRSNAIVWHVSLMRDLLSMCKKNIEATAFDTGENIQERRNTIYKLGYVLDDIVFNASSIFDYLADLILKCHLPDYRGDRQWSRVLSVKILNKIDDKTLVDHLNQINTAWVRPLSNYRGGVIHKKAEMGGAGLTIMLNQNGSIFEHDITLPDRALEILPIFSQGESIQIYDGAMMIARETLKHAIDIIHDLGSYEYKPLRTSVLEQNKFG